MSVVLFVLILGALIFVHELGHFLAAKKNGIRVDEFAVGFPPTLFSVTKGGTRYCLNLIPFGGYVKIFGENPDEESLDANAKDSFVNKSRWVQALVLVAGVVFNIVFAWFIFLIILSAGAPTVVTDENIDDIVNSQIVVTSVYEESPATVAGILPGDVVVSVGDVTEDVNVSSIQNVISSAEGDVTISVERGGEEISFSILPETGVVSDVPAIGIAMENIGVRRFPLHIAFVESFKMTGEAFTNVFAGLGMMWNMLTSGEGDLDQVAGPVGIVSLVGNAAQFGWANVLAFTAILSINLAVLNILPFPALDGGRLVFLGVEGVTRRRIKPAVANWVNGIGFLVLIGFMIVVTVNDVLRMF